MLAGPNDQENQSFHVFFLAFDSVNVSILLNQSHSSSANALRQKGGSFRTEIHLDCVKAFIKALTLVTARSVKDFCA